MKPPFFFPLFPSAVLLSFLAFPPLRAAELASTDPAAVPGSFGRSVTTSGNLGIVGAHWQKVDGKLYHGEAYVYRNLDTATGTVTQSAQLLPDDPSIQVTWFGFSSNLSGNNALIGGHLSNEGMGAAYLYRHLDTATGTVTQNAKLVMSGAPDSSAGLGYSVSLSGNLGVVGAIRADGPAADSGAAYVYRNLNTATGTVAENVKLTASDGATEDLYGWSASVDGNTAIVGALQASGGAAASGAAYVYRNLNTAAGTVTQNVKLVGSDVGSYDSFGRSVSISGTMGLIGASSKWEGSYSIGAAYVYRNLDTATGTVIQNAKLVASDAASQDAFGFSVSLSGNVGLIGSQTQNPLGAAYLYLDLDSASGTVTENVKLTASNRPAQSFIGWSVSLSGDDFILGSYSNAFTGSVSSVTKLDAGNATRTIDGLSFVSKNDWTIGQTTDANIVQLTSGDTANVTAAGKAVYIGRDAGSDNNALIVAGTLTANTVNIGSLAGNVGNKLQIGNGGGTGSVTGDIINHGNLTFNRSGSSQHGNVISGSGTVTKLGPGTITLTATSTYSGLTSVNGGKLVVTGSIANSAVAINSGGTLGGPGTVGDVTIASGGTIAPGSSPGILNTGDETWNGGGSYLWELTSATGTAGTSWDMLNITGTLSLEALASNDPFTILVTSLTAGNTPGQADNFDMTQNYSWTLATTSGGVTGFSADQFVINTSGFQNLPGNGGFTVSQNGNDLVLNFTAVPEPSALVMLGCALGGLTLLRRRDR